MRLQIVRCAYATDGRLDSWILWVDGAVGLIVWRVKMLLCSSRCGYSSGAQQTSCSVGEGFAYIGCVGETWRWSVDFYDWSPTSISLSRIIRFYNDSFSLGTVAKLHKQVISFISHVCSHVFPFAWNILAPNPQIFIKISFRDILKF